MLSESSARISAIPAGELVLDVGGWAKPLTRADWMLDLLPYATRGLYGYDRDRAAPFERFTEETWVQRDICDREPWPFADDQFAFAVCSHTLEDVRDPVWVAQELQRVARAGYVEVPSRLEEQTPGINGPWAGWGHHHWLVDVVDGGIEFVFKHRVLDVRPEMLVPPEVHARLSERERVQTLWWEGSFAARERLLLTSDELDSYLAALPGAGTPPPTAGSAGTRVKAGLTRVAGRLRSAR